MTGSAAISIRDVWMSFPGPQGGEPVHVLERVNLEVSAGEFVCIVGPSGCGKSTLLNIVAGLEQPTSGAIYLDGRPVEHRLGLVGYMQQKDLLLPWRTVLDNAVLGLELVGVPRGRARARALELMERFGLKGFEREYPHALSGGMRQRAAFLRTVLADQQLLLLDEPFGALDALSRAQMQEWLLALWETLKRTIVLVTHDVEEAILLSDRVYVLSARPARVKQVESVGLPRPRRLEMTADADFIAMKARLLAALRHESAPGEARDGR